METMVKQKFENKTVDESARRMGPTLAIAVSCLGNKEGLKRCCETMGHLTKHSFVKIGRIINGSP